MEKNIEGIKINIDYGLTVPAYSYTGINIRFNYENQQQIDYIKELFSGPSFKSYMAPANNGIIPYLQDANGEFCTSETKRNAQMVVLK